MKLRIFSGLLALFCVPFFALASSRPATLYVGPATGSFSVGSTFTVSFYVDTGDQFINVVDAQILFPPDKLQVVSPSTGSSFINVWAIQPSYSNTDGTMSFRGAVPSPGVNTSNGLISTVTFRVKSVGSAAIRFGGTSKVLLNDGLGTNILSESKSGVYSLVLPPPAGPLVSSPTHPAQTNWYSEATAVLRWADDGGAEGYSYMLSRDPVSSPDNIVDTTQRSITYQKLESGRQYFHIKALRGGVWGGVTHFAINVDTRPPAEFPISIAPSARTAQRQPVITFLSTDAESGVDHYEIKMISLAKSIEEPLFTEITSPYLPNELSFGRYDVYVRAYDIAGNFRESIRRLEIVPRLFEIVQGQGISFRNIIFIPWALFWSIAMLILLVLGVVAWKLHWWHHGIDAIRGKGELPGDVAQKLRELKEYQERYGKIAAILLFVVMVSVGSFTAHAATPLSPPTITTMSRDIFSDEIFYVGGKIAVSSGEVILYVQRLENGDIQNYRVVSDAEGSWFYRANEFLDPGRYVLWTQGARGEELSPPSPQVSLTVASHAIQVGSSRVSYEMIYAIAVVVLLIVVLVLAWAIVHHYRHGKRKHERFLGEKAKIEESIRRGFALLRRDIEEEIRMLRHTSQGQALSPEEKDREEQLLKDLDTVKRHIGDEIWELEKLESDASY